MNLSIHNQIPDKATTYKFIDTGMTPDEVVNHSTHFLNSPIFQVCHHTLLKIATTQHSKLACLPFLYETSIYHDFSTVQDCQWKYWSTVSLKLQFWKRNSWGKMYYFRVYRWSLQICRLNSNVLSFRCECICYTVKTI